MPTVTLKINRANRVKYFVLTIVSLIMFMRKKGFWQKEQQSDPAIVPFLSRFETLQHKRTKVTKALPT